MSDYLELKNAIEQFDIGGEVTKIQAIGHGHIHSTFEVTCDDESYILQEINHYVFRHPRRVVGNEFLVTEYLRSIILQEGEDPDRETLNFIYTKDGDQLLSTDDGSYYRMYRMIKDVEAYDEVPDNDSFFQAAKAIGKFSRRLKDFDSAMLYETIPDFHNTRARLSRLYAAIRADMCGRVSECSKEIAFVMERIEGMGYILDGMTDGSIPKRVTHNDTKMSNILLDPETKEGICVIDLDTVMEGSVLYDFGDALRSGTAVVTVDEDGKEHVTFDIDRFKAFTGGFLSEMGDQLTRREKELLAYSGWLMSMELGVRYLTDYFSGDVYFKNNDYPGQNLDLARKQFALAQDIEYHKDELEQIIGEMLEKYHCK